MLLNCNLLSRKHCIRAEITKASYDLESYKQIMGVIARRLQDQGEDWRHVYKSLLLLEYMAKHGPQKVGVKTFHWWLCLAVSLGDLICFIKLF
jgi:hypothetical protein